MATKSGAKTTIVLLHGLGGSRADWDEVVPLLSKGHPTLALDLPGAGSAPKPEDGYEPAPLAAHVLLELRKEKLEKAHLVGHSIGARVAGEMAAREPGAALSLTLVSPLGAVAYGLADKLKWKGMSRRSILKSVPESSMRSATAYGFVGDGPARRRFVERALAARTGRDADAVCRAVEKCVDGVLGAPPLVERLKGTRMPLLLVAGSEDPLAPPRDTREIIRARADARLELLNGAGHYPMIEEPKAFAKLLLDFLKHA